MLILSDKIVYNIYIIIRKYFMRTLSCKACTVCTWTLIVGGLQLGLLGIFEWDLIGTLTNNSETAERVIYVLIGIATVGVIAKALDMCKVCKLKK
jgi:uncharacterized membrane protein YuzA (DUF378 family)